MLFPPHYTLTSSISKSLQRIEAARQIIDTYPLPTEIETNIRRLSVLRSSLFSARIEGNPITMDDYTNKPSSDQKKREVTNILKGLQFVHDRSSRDLTIASILQIRTIVMDQLIDKSNLGQFRTEVSAIFNSAGIAIYMPPPPLQIPKLVERMITYSNNSKEQFIPIRAILTHYLFEKIHPFLDGNGRVGRLIMQQVLGKGEYGMKGLLSIEEYLDENRSRYYRALEETERDVTGYVEFMLEALATSADIAKNQVIEKQNAQITDYLLPRRAEIFYIIKDHKIVNFDQLRRRFMAINGRTLRYDIKKLCDAGLVRKRGTTKGVYYEIVN